MLYEVITELGHAMHSHYSAEAQPFETSHYRILAAEVASTVNETLMTHHLLKGETDRVKRAYYITQFLESFRTTCFRQTIVITSYSIHYTKLYDRPLRIAILNLMPTKQTTETQILRLLANTPLQVEVTLLRTGSYQSQNISQDFV